VDETGRAETERVGDMDPSSADVDRNLLYGLLALRTGLIDRGAFVAAMNAWAAEKTGTVGQILVDRRALDPADLPALERVVERHLERYGGDPSRSLTALDLGESRLVRELLKTVVDPSLRDGLARLAPGGNGPPRSAVADETTVWGESGSARDLDVEVVAEDDPAAPGGSEGGARFRVIRPHARGGLGEVFLAWDRELGRHVALKEIRGEHARNERARARFVREAEVNGNLEHPGVVPVYALGNHPDGRPYYAMRFVQGETLQAALERFHAEARTLDAAGWASRLRHLLRRLLDICDAVDYAHSRGVLHRDLKPANILLGTYGEALIIDWGLAKVMGRPDPSPAPEGGAGGP
jgi:serine/threonine-protein kinase